MSLAVAGLYGVLLLAGPFPTAATHRQTSPCDQRLSRPSGDVYGYQLRGDRCEGVYAREVAGDAKLLLVSLTESFQKFDARSGQPIQVRWAAPDITAGVRLRSYSLRQKLYYRMDTTRPAGDTSYVWPTSILGSLGLSRDDIGVVGWFTRVIGGAAQPIYVPLRLVQDATSHETRQIGAVILPSAELTELFVSVARLRADGSVAAQLERDRPLKLGFYPADRGIRVPLPPLTLPGVYLVEIGATLRMGGSSTTRFWMHHDGN